MIPFTPSPGTGDLYANPNFINPAGNDFSLNTSSSLIEAGQFGYNMGAVQSSNRPIFPADFEVESNTANFTVNLSWYNPETTVDGTPLTSLSGVHIYRNDELIQTFTGMNPGAMIQYIDTVPVQGPYRYRVSAFTSVEGVYDFSSERWIGQTLSMAPTGPDLYGYMGYENTDPGGPVFNWIEIDPNHGGPGTELPFTLDDQTFHVPLPFNFKYYGLEYDTISVCSNGWVSMGVTYEVDFSNSAIPYPDGPPGMIALLWEKLSPQLSGSVSYYYDPLGHWFVVEYFAVRQYVPSNAFETMQVVLYDPAFHQTSSGDGKILVQWLDVTEVIYATFGIENHDQNDGLQLGAFGVFTPDIVGIIDNHSIMYIPPEIIYPVTVTLTPLNPPINIPAAGGSFGFTVDFFNGGEDPENFDAWIDVVLPNGTIYGPVLSRSMTLQPAATYTRNLTQQVPASAPGGSYDYHLHVGDAITGESWAMDNFNFTKEGSALSSDNNWGCTGWGDDEFVEQGYSPENCQLLSASPNPFNPETTLRYSITAESKVSLKIYDIQGREVAVLLQGEMSPGMYESDWQAADFSSGIYFAVLTTDYGSQTKKLLLLNRVGGGIAPAVLSHHRTYGSVYGGSFNILKMMYLIKQ